MDSSNRLGDIEITDPQAMRAPTHPMRLAILDRLQRHGPATATQLAPDVGATPTVTSWHLRHLAGFGLVRDSEPGPDRRRRRWEAVARGFRFETPKDPADEEGQSAARVLSQQMFLRYADVQGRWAAEVEPALGPGVAQAGRAGPHPRRRLRRGTHRHPGRFRARPRAVRHACPGRAACRRPRRQADALRPAGKCRRADRADSVNGPDRGAQISLWRDRPFRNFWAGQSVSQFGDRITELTRTTTTATASPRRR